MSFPVLECIFDHGNQNDYNKRSKHDWFTCRNRYIIYTLQTGDHGKVKIAHFLELLEQVERQEIDYCVLRGFNLIMTKCIVVTSLLGSLIPSTSINFPLFNLLLSV